MKNVRLKHFLKSPVGMIAVVVVVLLATLPGYYFYQKYQQTRNLLQNSNAAARQQVNDIINKVGKLIVLPNEQPTVATVSDINKLKDQAFFKNAQNGDKVLIFRDAREAILYRPSINKIIKVGPVNLGQTNQAQPSVSPTQLKVIVYNGTTTVGLGGQVEKQIQQNNANLNVIDVANANKNTYTKTLVIDLKGNNGQVAKEVAAFLNGEVTSMPQGEATPSADILVIVGK